MAKNNAAPILQRTALIISLVSLAISIFALVIKIAL